MCITSFKIPRVIRLAAALLLLELTWSGAALALDPEKAITQYLHQVWQIEDGLPSNVIPAIVQTRDGYLWLGTEGGLVRFDGVRFTVFNPESTETIKSYSVESLCEGQDGSLWIGTAGGLIRLKDGQFTTYTTKDGLPDNRVTAISEDREGNLWIATYGGELSRLLRNGTITTHSTQAGWPGGAVISIYRDREGNLWIGTSVGLVHLSGEKFTTYPMQGDLPKKPVRPIYEDRRGNLWIGTEGGGLYRFKDGRVIRFTTSDGLSHNYVRAIYEDREGNLWIGTYGRGLNRLKDRQFTRFTTKDGLSDDRILAICEDREGSLWIGTYGGGLNRFKDGKLTTYTTQEGLSHDWAYSIYEDRAGNLWVGTKGGLNRFKDGTVTTYTTKDGLSHNMVRSLYEDRAGTLWIGTQGGGLNGFKAGRFTTYTTRHGLSSDHVRSIYVDHQGSLWVGTLVGTGTGLHRFKDGRFIAYARQDGSAFGVVYSMLEGHEGSLWVGTNNGLFRLKDGESVHYMSQHGLPDSQVMTLYEDRARVLWIGTYGAGLSRFKNGTFTTYTMKEGLPDNVVYQILEDERRRLWISSNKGIFYISKDELNEYAEGRIGSITSVSYGKADGMKAIECSGAHQPAGWKTRDGRLWFPTTKGLVMIDPQHLKTNILPPPVYIEQVMVDQKPLGPDEKFELPPGKAELEFHYTALSFLDPKKVEFRYRLEGYDKDWVTAGTRRVAYYTNLSPGDYRFRVIACNNDGVWNEAGAAAEFSLKPHFYQTTRWFYTLCAMVLILLGPSIYLLRVRQLKAREKELERLVEERTKDLAELNQTLEQRVIEGVKRLTEAERMAAYGQLVTGVAHEVRNPLFALQTAAYVIETQCGTLCGREGVRPQLSVLQRETKRMARLMEDLLEFAKPKPLLLVPTDPGRLLAEVVETYRVEHDATSPKIVLVPNPGLPPIVVDRSRLLQVLVNLIENAAKPARGLTTITLSVGLVTQSELCIRVKDDGVGIPPEHLPHVFDPFFTTGKGTGLGLAIVRRLVAEHEGTISVESEPGKGTLFTICLPTNHAKSLEKAF